MSGLDPSMTAVVEQAAPSIDYMRAFIGLLGVIVGASFRFGSSRSKPANKTVAEFGNR